MWKWGNQDKHILREHQFSTLQNYHVELGCNIPKQLLNHTK